MEYEEKLTIKLVNILMATWKNCKKNEVFDCKNVDIYLRW